MINGDYIKASFSLLDDKITIKNYKEGIISVRFVQSYTPWFKPVLGC